MRKIDKGNSDEPVSLLEYRSDSDDHDRCYDNFPAKDDLREALVAEQRAQCCYCMSRISVGSMRIEHWKPQTACAPLEDLAWNNLLGACCGGEGEGADLHHCDVSKGATAITLSPLGNHPAMISYRNTGKVCIENAELQAEIDDVLRLNIRRLQRNRQQALQGIREAMRKLKPGQWTKEFVERQKRRVLSGKHEFSGYLAYVLARRLDRM